MTKNKLENKTCLRQLIVGSSGCDKTYLMNHILHLKKPDNYNHKVSKSISNIKAPTSDENQPLENYENSTVVFDDMLLSRQESNKDLFFTRGRHGNNDIFFISQSYFHLPKNTIRDNTNRNILFKQTLRDIILLFHDIAGLDMNLEDWKQLCRKTWENAYDYLQIDRFAKKTERVDILSEIEIKVLIFNVLLKLILFD